MAEVVQSLTPVVEPADFGSAEQAADTSSKPHVEHEDAVESQQPADTNGTAALQPDDVPAALEVPSSPEKNEGTSKSAMAQTKPSMVVKPAAGANNGPKSPLVKRIINSGTFGAGTLKPTVKGSGAPTAPSLKTSISAPKPDTASSKPPSTTANTRRQSLAPSKPSAPPLSKSLSSSTSAKPTTTPATRPNVVSPAGSAASVKSSSVTRPRAPVSDSVKKASRQSLSAAPSKPLTAPAKFSTAPRIARASPSITSITEAKEDTKALEDLQNKLGEAEASLTTKAEAVTALEEEVNALKASLDAARTSAEAKQLAVQELTETTTISEKELKVAKDALELMRTERQEGDVLLRSVQQTLDATKANAVTQTDLIQNLQAKIHTMDTEALAAKQNFVTFTALKDAEAAAAAAEHKELIAAKADLDAIRAEVQASQRAHAQALEDATQKLGDVESKAARSEDLEAELAGLKKELQENVNRLSELEVEILELQDSQEAAEDKHSKLVAQLNDELSKALAAESLKEELKTASEEGAKLAAELQALTSRLAESQAAHEQAELAAKSAQETQNELSEQIKKITIELEGQEAQYNAKVDAIKAEHHHLLQEAFERAKNEAADAHGQDLQNLRAESQVTTEELRTAHQVTVENLKAEHAATLESEVKSLEKQINHQSIELKATQDDLAKAKTALDSARGEVETLTAQRDEARAAAAAVPLVSPEQAEAIERLKRELTDTKEDLAATNEVLELTKASISDMSRNHQIELEEAATGRAEEVTALRNTHDTEVAALATHKSELLMKLSDLEGELATVKASIAAEPPAPPKSNGAAHPSGGVTKEELQRLHEAHNSKVHDLQADHDRAIQSLKEELEKTLSKADDFQQDIARKVMEIQYLEQDRDDSQDEITRLKEDVVNANEQLEQYKTQNPVAA